MGNAGTVFASHAAREGNGGGWRGQDDQYRKTILAYFFSCVVCSSTYMGRGRVARIRYIEPLGHAARKAASAHLLSRARTWGRSNLDAHARSLLAVVRCLPVRKGRGRRAAATEADGTGTCTRSHTAAARRAWRPKRQQELRKATGGTTSRTTPHACLPTNTTRVASGTSYLRAPHAHTHTPPSHRSGLWSLSGVAEEGVAAASDALFVPRCSMLQTRA